MKEMRLSFQYYYLCVFSSILRHNIIAHLVHMRSQADWELTMGRSNAGRFCNNITTTHSHFGRRSRWRPHILEKRWARWVEQRVHIEEHSRRWIESSHSLPGHRARAAGIRRIIVEKRHIYLSASFGNFLAASNIWTHRTTDRVDWRRRGATTFDEPKKAHKIHTTNNNNNIADTRRLHQMKISIVSNGSGIYI